MKRRITSGSTTHDDEYEYEQCSESSPSSSNHHLQFNSEHKRRKNNYIASTGGIIGVSDEWTVVLEFLPIGSVLMLAMTCRENYEWICQHVRRTFLIIDMEGLSLTAILRMKKKLIVDSNNFDTIKEILTRTESVSDFPISLVFDNIEFSQLYSLLDFRKSKEHGKEINIETLCVPKKKSTLTLERNIKQKKITEIPLGYEFKNLTISVHYSLCDLYKILSKFRNLESLHIDADEEFTRSKRSKSQDSIVENCDDENYIYIPIMNNLTSLTVISYDLLFDVLKLAPNLTCLHCSCETTPNDNLLQLISTMCPKLKKLTIEADYSEMTDDGLIEFLTKNQKNLEYLDIRPTPLINGKVYSYLGNFNNLKYFRIRRCKHYSSVAPPLVDNFQSFGELNYSAPSSSSSLQYFDIGTNCKLKNEQDDSSFVNNLYRIAPNLYDFHEMDHILFRPGQLTRKFSQTLQVVIATNWNIQCLHECPNLRRVVQSKNLTLNLLDSINQVCPQVIELKWQDPLNDQQAVQQLARVFPSIEVLDMVVINQQTLNPFVESLKDSKVWPKLTYLKITNRMKLDLGGIVKERPNIYIESKRIHYPIIPQTFNYLWLVRDELNDKENFR